MIRVLFFGRLREVAGGALLETSADGAATIADLAATISEGRPDLAAALAAPGVRAARNKAFARFEDRIAEGDEIAFMSPLSGG